MFTQAWKIYLPVINILLKRSAAGEQTLHMNKSDFERAAAGRKVKFNFSLVLTKGKPEINANVHPLVKDLVSLLTEDPVARQLVLQQDFKFAMNSNFHLLISRLDIPTEDDSASN